MNKKDKYSNSWAFNGRKRKDGMSIRTVARVKYEEKRLGKFGPASSVRKIDLSEYKIEK